MTETAPVGRADAGGHAGRPGAISVIGNPRSIHWDNEADENVIESVTRSYDFFELVQ